MAKHLAGIIPLANFDDNYKLPYNSFLLPIQNDFTLIQKSVFECAMAGCSTIWIVANDDLAPLVKKHIGEWVYDPVYFWDNYKQSYCQRRTHIPIYYVPILPKTETDAIVMDLLPCLVCTLRGGFHSGSQVGHPRNICIISTTLMISGHCESIENNCLIPLKTFSLLRTVRQ